MNRIKLSIFILFVATINIATAQSGSFSSVKMTGGSSSSNIRPRIALNNMNYPVITWNKSSNKIISFSVWNGSSFNTPITLTPSGLQADVFTWAGQEIASIKDTVYIVYASLIGTESNVFIHKSVNGGNTFSDSVRVSNIGTDKSRFPTVAINGSKQPVVAFMRMLSTWADPKYVVSNSMNSGASFMSDVDASTNTTGNHVCDCCPATIVCKGNMQTVLFRDNDSNQRDIKSVLSYNGGASFDTVVKVDFNNWVLNACPSTGPDGHFGTDSLFTVFSTGATSPMKVFISATHPSLLQVGTHKVVSISSDMQQFPRIAGNADTIGIVWQQNNKVMLSYSKNGVAGLSNAIMVNDSSDLSSNPDIAYANNVFHIAWQSNSGMVHYRTFDMNGASAVQNFEANEISISPNPSSSAWLVVLSAQTENTALELYDVNGKIVFSKTLPPNTSIQHSISNDQLKSGNYFLKLHSGRKASTVKLLKL
ncbi:MAG: T9SS type A sorting domain-containing protein [Bacteroidetes bacterium]|nr:T9SS type A sorting domain-containing protein [Bacteroidota bacterium]